MMKKFCLILLFINVIIFLALNIFSKLGIIEGIIYSLVVFTFGIIVLLFFILLFYITYQFNELTFKIFTIFFLIGSLLGIFFMFYEISKRDNPFLFFPMVIFINIFILCLYIRIYIWKIDITEYLIKKRKKKLENDKRKICI